MSNGTIFFSYSRADQKFVLELAKKLRGIGADIWIDQLDIEAGRNWDKSVERALESSDSVLVVMSKTSVESVNVMDEVSIAIEEGKNVIPLLYEECKRPFRLKRRHYVDFTADKDQAFEKLVETLKLNKENEKTGIVDVASSEQKETGKNVASEPAKGSDENELQEEATSKNLDSKDKEAEAERNRIKKVETDRIKKELDAERTRLQNIEDDRLKKDQEAEKNRLQKIEDDRIKKEKEAEASRLEKIDADRIKREEEIRLQAKKEVEEKYKVKEKKKSKSSLIIAVVAILVLIGASLGWYFLAPQDKTELISEELTEEETVDEPEVIINEVIVDLDPDSVSFDSIKSSKMFADFESHMTRIDSCKHLGVIDANFWAMAQDSSESYSYQGYLENFPEGVNIEEAQQKIEEIEKEMMAVKLDSLAWAKASTKNDVTSLLGYTIVDSLKGSYRTEAFKTAEEIGQKGWLFIGRTKNETEMMVEGRVFDIVCCNKAEGSADKIPVKNDILKSKSQRRTYTGPTDSPENGSIRKNKLAQVLEVKLLGNVVYVQILY